MIDTEMLNSLSESWSRFMLSAVIDTSVLLALLCLLWALLHRRVSAQFGYCVFMLVLFRVVVPVQITLPDWCGSLSPTHAMTRLLQSEPNDHVLAQVPTAVDPVEIVVSQVPLDPQRSP